MMQIRVEQTFERVGLNLRNSQVSVRQNVQPKVNVDVKLGGIQMRETRSEVSMDWSQVQAEMGLKNLTYSRRDMVGKALQQAEAATRGYVAEGDHYAMLPADGNAFAVWEKQRALSGDKAVHVASVPSVGSLRVEFSKPSLQFQATRPTVEIRPDRELVQVEADGASVDVYRKEKYSVDIRVVPGGRLDVRG